MKPILLLPLALVLSASAFAQEGTWKTAYVKRGFVGMADSSWIGGPSTTIRMRTPLQYDGTKVRVYVRGGFEHETELSKMALIKGADDTGKITGTPFPILFKGTPGLKLEKGLKSAVSDEATIPITRGTWYVEDQYASAKFPYAYEIDKGYSDPGDAFVKESLAKSLSMRAGIVYRVDVFTTDPRASIVCYGDSITHGVGSTPNTGRSYPAILSKLLDRPVLNLGQNSDVAAQNAFCYNAAHELSGADTLVFLMGINDIVLGSRVKTVKDYSDILQQIIANSHRLKLKIYIGTIPPAGGLAAFDKDPNKETMRRDFNTWIAQGHGADGVIDFSAALTDPADPRKLRADCQTDWIHPNDLGYQKMAETAAKVLSAKQ